MLPDGHADPVGRGVSSGHKQYVPPADPAIELSVAADLNKGDTEWSDTPTYPDQMSRGDQYWKPDHLEIKVLDMTDEDDVKMMGQLLTETSVPGYNRSIVAQERHWCEATSNWKIYVEIQYVKFLKILKKKSDTA